MFVILKRQVEFIIKKPNIYVYDIQNNFTPTKRINILIGLIIFSIVSVFTVHKNSESPSQGTKKLYII